MSSLKKYIWVAHLFAIAICSYFAAQTVTTYLGMLLATDEVAEEVSTTKMAQAAIDPIGEEGQYEPIIARNMFSSVELEAEPELPPEAEQQELRLSGPAEKTTLNIKVLGTMMVGNGEDRRSSTAIVGGKSRKPEIYFVKGKETFEEGVTLVRVKKDRIEFVNKGRLEYAMLEGVQEELTIFAEASQVHGDSGEGGIKVPSAQRPPAAEPEERPAASGDAIIIDQAEVDEALGNLDRLYTEVRIVPNFKDGKPAGMKVLAIKPGSIFSKLGLQRGDVLERINGLDLDIKSGMKLFGQLKDQKSLKIDLVRRGEQQTLEYEIR